MKNFVNVIKACQNAGGAGSKAAIQAVLSTADEDTKSLIWYALNPYLTYGVRKWEQPTKFEKDGVTGISQFLDLLQALSSRSLTGNAAQEAVTKVLSLYTAEQAGFLELVIEKDLKSGFSEETANKVWKGGKGLYDVIPTFEVMLADKCESPEEFEKSINFPCQADWKYDGTRVICIVRDDGPVEYRARSGKPSSHLDGLFDADLFAVRRHLGYDFVLDGEAFASDFTETINAKKSGNDEAKNNLKIRAFFLMPLTDWMSQKTTITMKENRDQLMLHLNNSGCKKVILSEGKEVQNYAEMVAYCNEVIDVHGQEGLILKDWDAVYEWDRKMTWCKVKRMHDVDARITGWYKGRPKSRLEDTCGGLNIEGIDEKGRKFQCNVGSGFNDADRDDIANNFEEKYLGKTAVITFQEISQAKGAKYFALRFPIYNHVRDDKIVAALEE